MKKVILVDGNNLLFRSYYATAYSGTIMRNSKGFPTNALYGLVNMLNKIIADEKPEYIIVALDKGKTFRHDKYKEYKAGRKEIPEDLKRQFPVAYKLLDALGITYLECPNYEADDIIGTIAKMIDEDKDFIGTIISSDRDLLQLISKDIEVKLLKQKDYLRLNEESFKELYGIDPIRIIDLKGLQGDASDNIPGVKGIGEKTALKLLQEYGSLDGIYENVHKITGSVHNKLVEDRDNAYYSAELATICKDAPINISLEDIKYKGKNVSELTKIYTELDFFSFLKSMDKKESSTNTEVNILEDFNAVTLDEEVAIYLDLTSENYHRANLKGISVYGRTNNFYLPFELLEKNIDFFKDTKIIAYDVKKVYIVFKNNNLTYKELTMDVMIAAYLLNYNVKDDVYELASSFNEEIPLLNKKELEDHNKIISTSLLKTKFIYDIKHQLIDKLKEENLYELYTNIEFPLAFCLARMELEGIRINKFVLNEMKEDLKIKIELISQEIYNMAGGQFNIASPKQLGDVLFNDLHLPFGKKTKTGYSTDVGVLMKLKSHHPIIDKILEYRSLTKMLSTYIEGISNAILDDGKIHTIYTQTLTRTGRLSSLEPNLQNIPVRSESGKLVRKAFVPEKDSLIMSSDYSQIELRIFAHMSEVPELIKAFNNNEDIHARTAMEIFGVPEEFVTKDMRRQAKAVNFGILYGISSFGLSESLEINVKDAKKFIEKYLETFPGIKNYMDTVIKNAHVDGYVTTITNRKRFIEELKSSNYMVRSSGERMALNTPIQGSSADILKKAMVEIDEALRTRNLKSKMLLQVHDELIFNVTTDEKEIMKNLVTEIMENTYKISVPLVVDVEFGSNWYEAK